MGFEGEGTAAHIGSAADDGDGIWITVKTNLGTTGACSGTWKYAEAKK